VILSHVLYPWDARQRLNFCIDVLVDNENVNAEVDTFGVRTSANTHMGGCFVDKQQTGVRCAFRHGPHYRYIDAAWVSRPRRTSLVSPVALH
jgi:hypothetical protein